MPSDSEGIKIIDVTKNLVHYEQVSNFIYLLQLNFIRSQLNLDLSLVTLIVTITKQAKSFSII